jgi:hypothetical protein
MGAPQSPLAGIAVTAELEIIFDPLEKSRKFANIARDARVAFLIGWQGQPHGCCMKAWRGTLRLPSWVLTTKSILEIYRRAKSPEVGRHDLLRGHADVDSLPRLRPNPAGNC